MHINLTDFTVNGFDYVVRMFAIITRILIFIFGRLVVGFFIIIAKRWLVGIRGIGCGFGIILTKIIVAVLLVMSGILFVMLGICSVSLCVMWIVRIIEFLRDLGFSFMIAGNFVKRLAGLIRVRLFSYHRLMHDLLNYFLIYFMFLIFRCRRKFGKS